MYNSNPYFPQMPQIPQNPYMQTPRQEITKVNGENGARAYSMAANSSALLLDESGLIVWLVVTDGAGYKTVAPYDITPHQTAPTPDFTSLEQRISRLEELINGNTTNTTTAKSKPSNGANQPSQKLNAYSPERGQPSGSDASISV